MTFDELKRINAEIRRRAIPPVSYRGVEWYVYEPGKGVIDTRELSQDEIDALMRRVSEPQKWFGRQGIAKPILVGPELLKWIASKNTEKSEEDHEHETQAETEAR